MPARLWVHQHRNSEKQLHVFTRPPFVDSPKCWNNIARPPRDILSLVLPACLPESHQETENTSDPLLLSDERQDCPWETPLSCKQCAGAEASVLPQYTFKMALIASCLFTLTTQEHLPVCG